MILFGSGNSPIGEITELMKQREISDIETQWLEDKMKEKQEEFSEIQNASIVCVTWNVAQKTNISENLTNLLHLNELEADIYAIGLQEVDMSPIAMVKETTEASIEWINILMKHFSKCKHKYVVLAHKQLVGLFLCIIIKNDLKMHVKKVKTCSVGTGALNIIGNKGGVSIRFNYLGSTICFVNVHLIHKQNTVPQRNQNLLDIYSGTSLQFDPFSHDALIMLGDFNYRLNFPEFVDCQEHLKNKNWDILLERDQLRLERDKHNILSQFEEAKITFPPTYKYKGDHLDHERIPSYTDRILVHKGKSLDQRTYQSHQWYVTSDHKPVSAKFMFAARKIVPEKYQKYRMNLIRELSKLENQSIPILKIHNPTVKWTDCLYNYPQFASIEIENVGKVPCEWNYEEIRVKWLAIEPMSGLVMPGEKMIQTARISITPEIAYLLNNKKEMLDTIEILKIRKGGDFFISFLGEWKLSVFGNSIDHLCEIGSLSVREWTTSSNATPVQIPKEIINLVTFLVGSEKDVLEKDGDTRSILTIRELLDNGKSLESLEKESIHSVFETLIDLLKSLHEPVYTHTMKESHIPTFKFLCEYIKPLNIKFKVIFASILCRNEIEVPELMEIL